MAVNDKRLEVTEFDFDEVKRKPQNIFKHKTSLLITTLRDPGMNIL